MGILLIDIELIKCVPAPNIKVELIWAHKDNDYRCFQALRQLFCICPLV